MMTLVILAFFTVVLCGYLWLKQRFKYWENRRIPHLKSESLVFGNEYDSFTGKLSMGDNCLKNYRALAPQRFGGLYSFFQPVLYVRDPELIKHILIKDFHHFYDRSFDLASKKDPLTRHLFSLTGEEWKTLRQKLSPTFTSGKMKILFGLMQECVGKLERILDESALNHDEVQVKDLMGRYATDVISSCAFGLEASSLENPDSEFRVKGKEFITPSLRGAVFFVLPKLFYFFGLKVMPRHLNDFFFNLVSDTIAYRTTNGIVRNDFLNLLINLRKENPDIDINCIAAQCFVFYVAGFDAAANSLSFILYELAEHKDVQKKLQDEIDHVLKKYKGQITYESLQEMNYLDQVFNETTRLFPGSPFLMRVCTEDYHIPDSDYIIKKGESLHIPLYALHRDPQYYPNPDVFNPDNFSEEAKASRPTCSFLPFGDGPRNCIGMRFASIQVKVALVAIMRKYTVTVSPKMKLPMELLPKTFSTTSKHEILLYFNKRSSA